MLSKFHLDLCQEYVYIMYNFQYIFYWFVTE